MSDLPEGWTKQLSRSQNKEYYFHEPTGSSVWNLNEVFVKRILSTINPPKLAVNKQIRAKQIDEFEERVKKVLKDFIKDPRRTQLTFEPCAKDLRYIIGEVVDDEALSSRSEVDNLDVFVTVYKQGHNPDDIEDTQVAESVNVPAPKKRNHDLDLVPLGDLEAVIAPKRDRRTFEDLQQERIKKHKH